MYQLKRRATKENIPRFQRTRTELHWKLRLARSAPRIRMRTMFLDLLERTRPSIRAMCCYQRSNPPATSLSKHALSATTQGNPGPPLNIAGLFWPETRIKRGHFAYRRHRRMHFTSHAVRLDRVGSWTTSMFGSGSMGRIRRRMMEHQSSTSSRLTADR